MGLPATTLEAVSLLLVALGAGALAVLYWVYRQTRWILHAHEALLALNRAQGRDALHLLRAAWPVLARAGVTGWQWHCCWYGQEVRSESGHFRALPPVERRIAVADLSCRFALWWGSGRGEDRLIAEVLADTLALLIENDLWREKERVTEGFAQMERVRAVLLHDTKNLAQSVQLLAGQWERLRNDFSAEKADLVGKALTHAQERAERILRQLSSWEKREEGDARQSIVVSEWLCKRAERCGLQPECRGTAQMVVSPQILGVIFDNLLDNLLDEAHRTHRDQVRVVFDIEERTDQVAITLYDPDAAQPAHPERLLQPFWSSSGGMGLGLKQVAWLVQSQGGSLSLDTYSSPGGLRVTVIWPKQ